MDSTLLQTAQPSKKQRRRERKALEMLQNQSAISNESLPIHPSQPQPRPHGASGLPTNAPSDLRAMHRWNPQDNRAQSFVSPRQEAALSARWQPNLPLPLLPFLINSHQYYAFDEDETEKEALSRSQIFPSIEAIPQRLPTSTHHRTLYIQKSTRPFITKPSATTQNQNAQHSLDQRIRDIGSVEESTKSANRVATTQVGANLPNGVDYLKSSREHDGSDVHSAGFEDHQDRVIRPPAPKVKNILPPQVVTLSEDVIFTPTKAIPRVRPVGDDLSLQVEQSSGTPPINASSIAGFNVSSHMGNSQAGREGEGVFNTEPYVLNFGKYEGKTLGEVQEIDVTYIMWLKDHQVYNRQAGLAEGLAAYEKSEEAKITREQLRMAAAEYPIVWGKYAGVALKDVPRGYRQWLMDDESKSRPKLMEMLKLLGHRKKQPITSPIPSWWAPADMQAEAARSFLDDYNREDSLISPFDAFRFFGLPKAYYLERLSNSDGNHWLYQVYDLLAACEGKPRAEAALEDFLTHNSDREADGFII